jgi:hypothetical protein
MAIKKEVVDWLKSLPLGDDARKALEADLEKKEVQDAVGKSVMATADYSRAMDKLRDQETEMKRVSDEAIFKANNLLQQNVTWRNKNEATVRAAVEDANKKGYILQTLQTKLQALAEQGLIDPREFDVTAPGAPAAPAVPLKKFMTEEDISEAFQKKEMQFAYAMANFEDIADQHKRLFNEPLKRTELVQEMLQKGQSLEDVWKAKYKVDDRLKEMDEAVITDRIKKAVDEERATILSSRTASPGGGQSPVMGEDHIISILKPVRSAGMSDSVRAAVDSYNRGEFRTNENQPPKV